jgi:enamine deaminase RidA (YjgF/YER057c/UK114 family)
MTITRISSGSSFEALAGYSRAVVIERNGWREVLVSGCTGFDYASMSIPDGIEAQARQAFANVAAALRKAGGGLEHLVRIRVYLASAQDFAAAAPIVGEHCRAAMPANTTVACALVDPRMLIEVEADARIPVGVEG